MSGLRRLLVALAATLCLSALAAPAAHAAISVFPDSMAATGASATRAALTCPEGNCARNSLSTVDNPTVNSIYLRLAALNPDLTGNAYNDAVGGEDMSDLRDQFEVVIPRNVEFVIVDMGGNDVCAREEGEV